MSIMSLNDIKRLQALRAEPSITIILPTHKTIRGTMPERNADPIEVKNALKEAEELLIKKFGKDKAVEFDKLLDDVGTRIDYSKTLDSLVLFISKDISEIYYLPIKLKRLVDISDRFVLEGLIRAFELSPVYWVLELSKNSARLFSAAKDQLKEMTVTAEKNQKETGFPFKWHYDITNDEKRLAVGTGYLDAKYLTDMEKEFMRDIDKRLEDYLAGNDLPLVLLGIAPNVALFKEVSKHKSRVIGEADGDWVHPAGKDMIAQKAWQVMQEYLEESNQAILEMIDDATSQKKFVSGLDAVLKAAQNGQVRILVLEDDAANSSNSNNLNVDSVNKIENLIDLVFEKDGKVSFVPNGLLDKDNKICAVLRYK